MYKQLHKFLERPEPFSKSTTKELWTRPHLAAQMLAYHLDGTTELASRSPEKIVSIVEWLDGRLELEGKLLCDLGCGPGLYAERFAQHGAQVTGVDFSGSSIEYAIQQAASKDLSIEYLIRDYLSDSLPSGFDIVSLIYCDFCAIAPTARQTILGKISEMLSPGGCFVFDVFAEGSFAGKKECSIVEENLMNGFWSAKEYIGFQNSLVYPDSLVSLDHYLIVEELETLEIFNWLQYFTKEAITKELEQAGFDVEVMAGSLAGDLLTAESAMIGIIARRRLG